MRIQVFQAIRESSRIRCFLELLEEAREGGHRLLVFSQFVDFLMLVRIMLDTGDGSIPEEARWELV